MAKTLLRERAIKLRIQGYTYGQIKRELKLAKSTLSSWLRNLPLDEKQFELLSKNRERAKDLAVERYIETRKKQKLTRLKLVFNEQYEMLLPLSEKELFLCGLFLYWGEGDKMHGRISISNTDPKVIKFALYWMTNSLKIPKKKIKINLHLYRDMNIREAINFWSETLGIVKTQFNKPYIKKTNRAGLTYKSFGHGTCKLYFGSTLLSEKIAMSVKVISDQYGAKNDLFWYN